jgi:hypothetical protein
MRCSIKRSLSLLMAALIVGAASPAGAQKQNASADAGADAQAMPSAQDLYNSAQKLFDRGSYAEALVAFRQAYNASNSPNARIMIGHCLIALGRPAEAYEEMAATLREAAKRAETEPKYGPTRDAAATQVGLLESKVGKVIVEVAERDVVEVLVNGARIGPNKLGVALAVEPGRVTIVAANAGGQTVRREQDVKAGTTEKVTITFTGAPSGGADGASGPRADMTTGGGDTSKGLTTKTGGGARTAGFVIAGLGVAGMAVFGVTGFMAKSKFQTLEEECGGRRCTDPKYADVVDSGMMLTTIANAGLIGGAAGIVVGGLMIALGGPSDAPPAAPAPSGAKKAGVKLRIGVGGPGLSLTGAF